MKIYRLVIPLLLLFMLTIESCSFINSLNGFSGRKYRAGIYRHDIGRVDKTDKKAGRNDSIVSVKINIAEAEEEIDSTATAGIDEKIIIIKNPLSEIFAPQKKIAQSVGKQLKAINENSQRKILESKEEGDLTGMAGMVCGMLAIIVTLALIFLLLSVTLDEYFLLVYLLALLFAIGAIAFGSANIKKNKKEPSKYDNAYMGHIAQIIGIVIAAVLVLMLFIALFILLLIILLFG